MSDPSLLRFPEDVIATSYTIASVYLLVEKIIAEEGVASCITFTQFCMGNVYAIPESLKQRLKNRALISEDGRPMPLLVEAIRAVANRTPYQNR